MISSPSNPSVKLVRALQARRREREEARAFVVEGVRLAEEAVRASARARLVLYTPDLDERGQRVVEALAGLGARVERVSPAVMRAASDTRAPQGLLAVVPFPDLVFSLPANPFVVVLDRLADPGNLVYWPTNVVGSRCLARVWKRAVGSPASSCPARAVTATAVSRVSGAS